MDDQGGPTPAQWATDPSGRHRYRYWDGTRWTGHVFDGGVAPLTPPGAAPQPTAPPRATRSTRPVVEPPGEDPTEHPRDRRDPPNRRSFGTGAVVGGAVVAFVAAIAWVTVGGSSSTTTTKGTTRQTTSTDLTSTTFTPTTLLATTTLSPGRPPAQVRVQVLNGSGAAGAAGTKATALKSLGYTIAGTGNAAARQGTVVQCKAGFETEAAALAQAVGSGATTQPAGVSVPAAADCVVIVGK